MLMRSDGLANKLSPARDPNPDLNVPDSKEDEANGSPDTPRPGPFRERRRTRPLADSRYEAVNTLNELLVRHEKTIDELRAAEEKYRTSIENALVGIFKVSSAGRPLSVNRMMARIHGYDSPRQFLAAVSNLRHQLLASPDDPKEWRSLFEESDTAMGIEAQVYGRDGSKKWVSLNLRAERDGRGRIVQCEGTAEDITVRKAEEERIRYLAYYDALTGLPNPNLFNVQLADALEGTRWRKGRTGFLLLELARFKIINDSLGHSFGDRLLRETAERIKRSIGKHGIVARVGGGEFAIVLLEIKDALDAMATAKRVIDELSAEFCTPGHSLAISCNIGISIFPDHGTDGEALLENADVALYSAKEDGPNRARIFTERMNVKITEELNLANGLGVALDRHELFLVYQPQVNISTGIITGLEALLRWQHPQMGLVPPAKFIPVAERSGSIVTIGEWVLRTACSQAKKWQDAGLPAVPVAVNVSAVQFRQQGFHELIRAILQDCCLEPKYLELELTESLLLTNADVMFSILQELREMGVKLAIDDFGTGYSSLSYLRQFHVNRLKIDRSFVRDVALNPDDAAIATAIINMAKAMNLEVLAEGVETEAQLSFFREQHCYDVQGFYFSRPVGPDEIAEQLRPSALQPASVALDS